MTLLIDSGFLWNETVWNPSMITTAVWLDAADASTVATESGAVSQWNDKSGNGRNATQESAVNRPLYTAAAQNSLSALSFDGVNDRLNIASTTIFNAGAADLGLFVAYKSKLTSGYGTLFGNFGRGGNFVLYQGVATPYVTPWGVYNGAAVDMDPGSHTTNKNYLVSLVRSSSSFTGWTDGSQKNTVSNGTSVAAPTTWGIGASGTVEHGFIDLYELIAINSAPSTLDRQRIEGYLAHKWGLTANLPADHPYKTVAPTV